jgi:O-antigen/teichoic acid export membrane protein
MKLIGAAALIPQPSVFTSGAAVYTAANWYLAYRGAKHRKRSGERHPKEEEHSGSGLAIPLCGQRFAIAIGALIDGIPESIAIGVSLIWCRRCQLGNSRSGFPLQRP